MVQYIRGKMNYYQHKAYFAAIELEELQRELAKLVRTKPANWLAKVSFMLDSYDKLAIELNHYEKQAKARILTLNTAEVR